MSPHALSEPIAVVGMACRVPGAADVRELWCNVRAGVESITAFDEGELLAKGVDADLLARPDYVQAAGVLDDADAMDAAFFGLTPRDAETMDPQHRLFLELAWQALEDAGFPFAGGYGRVGVFGGVGPTAYLWSNVMPTLQRQGLLDPLQARIANDKDFLTSWVSYKLGLTGPSVVVQTACSTSLTAVHVACESLRSGECELALAGGTFVALPPATGYVAPEGGPASADGHCRPFDRGGRGFVPGSGGGMVVLKRLDDAQRDRDHVYAVVRGSAVGNDGGVAAGFTAPGVEGQRRVVAEALRRAGVPPSSIGYVETHGTGTALGDPIEIEALRAAFGPTGGRTCALGAVKANIGHLDAAAGVAGLIKAVLVLHHAEVPPLANFTEPNPLLELDDSPFEIPREVRPWPAGPTPRRAGVSSFGMGGTNAHVVVEEAPPVDRVRPRSERPWLFPVSARTESALDTLTARLATRFGEDGLSPVDAAWTLQVGRRHFAERRFVVAASCDEAATHLADRRHVSSRTRTTPAQAPHVAFLFPGQGAQREGMAGDLVDDAPVFRDVLAECAELLRPRLGWDVRSVVCGPRPDLAPPPDGIAIADTALAQPVLFAVEYALARQWTAWGVTPSCMVGHSLGEYTAACLAGVFALDDALAIVAERGRLMQACPPGAMVALRSSPATTYELMASVDTGSLEPAAVNGPGDCVVAGDRGAVERLAAAAREAGVGAVVLETSHAFHSRLVEPAIPALRDLVASVARHPPTIALLSNRTGTWLTDEEATDPDYWAAHSRHPVRFGDDVAALLAVGDMVVVEVGPPSVAGLVRKHPSFGPSHAVLPSLAHHREVVPRSGERMLESLGQLWLRGLPVAWEAVAAPDEPARVPLPTYPFERRRYWLGDGVPDHHRPPAPTTEVGAPDASPDGAEAAMLSVWRDVFGDPGIGPDDNFFDLGGDSLRAIQLLNRLADVLGVSLSVEVLFDADTPSALAAAAASAAPAEPRVITVSLARSADALVPEGARE